MNSYSKKYYTVVDLRGKQPFGRAFEVKGPDRPGVCRGRAKIMP